MTILGSNSSAQTFAPGKIAVLQLGDGGAGRCLPGNGGSVANPYTNYNASDVIGSRQTAMYIDQFDPNGVNMTVPSVQIPVPTNGSDGLFINGNAGTEGNMTLAGDKSVLAVTGYAGDILSITTGQQTAPSNLSYDRGIGTIDAFGVYTRIYRGGGWYGIATGKTNPRGVATDGVGNFWGCGNGYGSLFYNSSSAPDPLQFQNIALTSASRVINNTLYVTVKSSESVNAYPAGIYSFVDFFNNPVPFPTAASFLHLEIPANSAHNNCIGFDIKPSGDEAYMADATVSGAGGITKYYKSGTTWNMAYHLQIPGYTSLTTGTMTNAASIQTLVGCFNITVDWSGTDPVIYATTADSGVSSSSPYYGNRVIRINDTNKVTSGVNIIALTNILTTVVKPPGTGILQLTNVVFKSVTFTPDLRPVITNQPVNWSAVTGDNVSFTVAASSPYTLSYQWFTNGAAAVGETSATLNKSSVLLTDNNLAFQCVVSNVYGSVTSSVAKLTVNSTPQLPVFGTSQTISNAVGNNQALTVAFTSGTDPKGGYQWFHNGALLTDGPTGSGSTLIGTTSTTLLITQIQTADAGTYSLSVTNVAGSASNTVASFTTYYSAPVMIQPPVATTTFLGTTITNSASAYGQLLTYQWYVRANSGTLTALSDSAHFQGTATAALIINSVTNTDATNFVLTVTNPGGSITSAPALLTVVPAPYHTFVNYTNAGQVYTQTFNSLPIPGSSSAEGANPLHITYVMTNIPAMLLNSNYTIAGLAAELQYSTASPMDFGYPILATGGIGGLGLSSSMGGWYGWAQNALVFAATKGDQSQGAVVDNGNIYYADGTPLTGITNRALGLIATTKTGPIAFGAALFNSSTKTNNKINLSFTGELWRNNPAAQPLLFGYFIDYAGTNSTLQPSVWDATNGIVYLPSLNVSFPTSGSTMILDGTQSSNQVSLATSGLSISNWPPGTTLWLIWQAQTLGSAQNLAIDNLTFSTPVAPSIFGQPTNQTVVLGSSANFNVTAGGIPTPSYQWLKNGVNTGSGLTNLYFASVVTNDAADYSVIITNDFGSITSSVAKLTVLVPGTLLGATNSGSGFGATLNLSWPASQIGWNLQVQTNQLNKGLGTNWVNVPNSTTTNAMAMPLNPTNPSVFFRLKF